MSDFTYTLESDEFGYFVRVQRGYAASFRFSNGTSDGPYGASAFEALNLALDQLLKLTETFAIISQQATFYGPEAQRNYNALAKLICIVSSNAKQLDRAAAVLGKIR